MEEPSSAFAGNAEMLEEEESRWFQTLNASSTLASSTGPQEPDNEENQVFFKMLRSHSGSDDSVISAISVTTFSKSRLLPKSHTNAERCKTLPLKRKL